MSWRQWLDRFMAWLLSNKNTGLEITPRSVASYVARAERLRDRYMRQRTMSLPDELRKHPDFSCWEASEATWINSPGWAKSKRDHNNHLTILRAMHRFAHTK